MPASSTPPTSWRRHNTSRSRWRCVNLWLHIEVNCSVGSLLPNIWCSRVTGHLCVHLPGRQAADQISKEAHHEDGPRCSWLCLCLLCHSAVSVAAHPVPPRSTQHEVCCELFLSTCQQHLTAPLLERFASQARDTLQWHPETEYACPVFESCLAMLQGRRSSAADVCCQCRTVRTWHFARHAGGAHL